MLATLLEVVVLVLLTLHQNLLVKVVQVVVAMGKVVVALYKVERLTPEVVVVEMTMVKQVVLVDLDVFTSLIQQPLAVDRTD